MIEFSRERRGAKHRTITPQDVGEAAMASIGGGYTTYPSSDEHGIRVPIPGHPEIVGYKLAGNPYRDHTIDDLIELHRLIEAEEAADADIR